MAGKLLLGPFRAQNLDLLEIQGCMGATYLHLVWPVCRTFWYFSLENPFFDFGELLQWFVPALLSRSLTFSRSGFEWWFYPEMSYSPDLGKSLRVIYGMESWTVFHSTFILVTGLIPGISVFCKQSFLPQQPSLKKQSLWSEWDMAVFSSYCVIPM